MHWRTSVSRGVSDCRSVCEWPFDFARVISSSTLVSRLAGR